MKAMIMIYLWLTAIVALFTLAVVIYELVILAQDRRAKKREEENSKAATGDAQGDK